MTEIDWERVGLLLLIFLANCFAWLLIVACILGLVSS